MCKALLLFALIPTTLAGKLADGWKGLPYGPDTVLGTSPLEGCAANPEEGVRWGCEDKVGEAAIHVSYMADEGRFYGVVVGCKGYSECSAFRGVLTQAWGEGFAAEDYDTSTMADWYWRDGAIMASWEWNRFSDAGQVVIFSRALMDQIKAIRAERAKSAAESL